MTDITQPTGPKPDESTARRRCNAVTQLARSSPQQHKKDSSLSGTDRNGHFKVLRPPLPLKPKKQKINLTSRPLPGQLLPPITASAERDDIKVKGESKALLAPNKTGSLHRPKNHCPIPKLDPSCLPQHCILPQHVVLENIKPTKSQKPSGKQSQSAKLEPVRKRQTEWTTASSGPLGTFLTRDESDLSQSKFSSSTFERSRERMTSSGPLRLDEMVLAEGVSLLDPPRDGKSCLQWKPPGVCMNLNPIQSEAVVPLYSVEQVVAGPPQVIPLSQPQKWDCSQKSSISGTWSHNWFEIIGLNKCKESDNIKTKRASQTESLLNACEHLCVVNTFTLCHKYIYFL